MYSVIITGFKPDMSSVLQGDKIQATCKHNYLKNLGSKCVVGEWKNISNFSVTDAKGHFRTTKHPKKITFINLTKINDCDYRNNDMFLSLMDFGAVLSGQENTSFLIGEITISFYMIYMCSIFFGFNILFLFYRCHWSGFRCWRVTNHPMSKWKDT